MSNARALRAVVGQRVRELRMAAGKTQDDVSRVAYAAGMAWSRSKIATLERGEKAISAEELIILPHVLTRALGMLVSTGDLFDSDAEIALTGKLTVPARAVLQLDAIALERPDAPRAGEADRRAARRLGVHVTVLLSAAQRLWGRSLAAERDARTAARELGSAASAQAHRGRITRDLDAEMRRYLGEPSEGPTL